MYLSAIHTYLSWLFYIISVYMIHIHNSVQKLCIYNHIYRYDINDNTQQPRGF